MVLIGGVADSCGEQLLVVLMWERAKPSSVCRRGARTTIWVSRDAIPESTFIIFLPLKHMLYNSVFVRRKNQN